MSLARQIFEAHRASAAPGRATSETPALSPDHLLIGPGATAFVLRLAPGVGGVDAALEFARRTDLRRWAGRGIEVSGVGVAGLGMGDRIGLTRTLARCGAAFVLLPCDEVTRETLRAWGRDADWRELP